MTKVIFGFLSGLDFFAFVLALAKLSLVSSTHSDPNFSYF